MRPFRNIADAVKNNIATRKWVVKFMRRVLGKLHFSTEGIDLIEEGDGQIHLRVKSASSASGYPFEVKKFGAASNGRTGVTVAPGLVYSNTLPSGQSWLQPFMAGKSLLSDPPPALAPNGNQSHICLVVEIGTDGKAINLPWEIKAFDGAAPTDIPVRRINSASGSPQQGKYHILIASIYATELYQWTKGNISIELQWEVLSVRA